MAAFKGIRRLLRIRSTPRSILREVDDEVRFHLQMRIEDLMRQGHSPDDARAGATREFGDLSAARSELASIDRRTARKGEWREWVASLGQDLRFSFRGLRARPAFTVTVLLTLALGIGANAAIFSVVNSVLLRPLPFARPDRLVHLWETYESKVDSRSEASYPDYVDWRARTKTFSDMAGYQGSGFIFGGSQPLTVRGARVTANFFDVLGVRPIVGRTFAVGEDAPGAARVVLLSYGFWQRQFGGDRNISGRSVTLDGGPVTIIGVLPKDFVFGGRAAGAELWAPIDRSAQTREVRGNHWLNVVARLRAGAGIQAARADMSSVMRALAVEFPRSNSGRDGQVVALHDELVGSVRPILILLYGAVVVVLLVACVNVANLLLIRGADRQREIAVRVALGAGRGRLVRQLLTESLLLSVCGGVLGLIVAQAGVRSIVGLVPARQALTIPGLMAAGLDTTVVTYALLTSLVAGLGFGIVPAFRSTKSALHDALKNAGRGSIGGASRLRDILVIGELALTVILMSGALLFGRSLLRLLSINPGFRSEQIVTTTVVLPGSQYSSDALTVAFFQRFAERIRELPGVESVGFTSKLPLDFGNSMGFRIVGQPEPSPENTPTASYRLVTPEYFRTLGIPLVKGRGIGGGDVARAPAVVVVNRAFVAAYMGAQDPVGQLLTSRNDTVHVVGVVGDVPIGNLEDKIPPTLYLSFAQTSENAMAMAIRTRLDAAQMAPALRRTLASMEPNAALTPVTTMDDLLGQSPSVFMRRFPLFLVGAFAITALLLAIVGVYGVVSYSVAQRMREMGIRTALGAPPRSLMVLVMRHGGAMAAVGIVVGVTAALGLGTFAEKLLFGVRANDPLTYLTVAAVLAAVAVGATLIPARRATRVDPATALRTD
ncbi:MAG: ABC transporter permease [bacterium]